MNMLSRYMLGIYVYLIIHIKAYVGINYEKCTQRLTSFLLGTSLNRNTSTSAIIQGDECFAANNKRVDDNHEQ